MNTETQRNWTEDYNQENGQYLNKCCLCEKQFIGHKRRPVCKECAVSEETEWNKLSDEEKAERTKIFQEEVKAFLQA